MCNCKCSEASQWTGIIRIHPSAAFTQNDPSRDGIHASLHLNSYRVEEDQHLYAITLSTWQVKSGESVYQAIVSSFAKDSARFSSKERSLALSTGLAPFDVEHIQIRTESKKGVEVFREKPDGTLSIEEIDSTLLRISSVMKVQGESFNLDASYLVPEKGCFWIQRKCVHDKCGPSWAHYSCNYRCLARSCSNNNDCGPWTKDGTCGPSCV